MTNILEDFDRKVSEQRQALRDESTSEIKQLGEEALDQINALEADATAKINRIRAEAEAQIEAVQSALSLDVKRVTAGHDTARHTIEQRLLNNLQEHDDQVKTAREEHVANKQHATTMVEMDAKAESARQLLDTMQLDHARLLTESKDLTKAINGLDSLKDTLAKSLPIQGLEVRDGELSLFATPLARWNDSVRVQLAIDIAKLSAGNLGLILVDGLERLDQETFEAFVEYAQSDETVQFIVSRVTEDPQLTIESF
jgi:hypothetical protein